MSLAHSEEQLRLAAHVVRGLAIDGVEAANSGHPGLPLGMADLSVALWLEHLRYDVNDPDWRGRDRFVLSAGHGSMLLYALLHLAGFELPLDELKRFRQLGSKTPGHPEWGETPGVETTTGPLGQGLSNAVGMALAARMEAERFDCPLSAMHRVIALVSDGDLMEGVASEACSLAGHLKLDNLIAFYDDNEITIDGRTTLAFGEDVGQRFEAYGWRVLHCEDAHEFPRIAAALDAAFGVESDRPTLVICRSTIGKGAPTKQDTAGVHGAPLGADEALATKEALGLPTDQTFWVPDEVRAMFRIAAQKKAQEAMRWHEDYDAWAAVDAARTERLESFRRRDVPEDLFEQLAASVAGRSAATRALGGTVLQKAAELVPSISGGSADLAASCKTTLKGEGDVATGTFAGRNLHFGIREHAMGAILNGMVLHGGHLPFGSTFLVFSDYMRPPMRLAALMGLRSVFVFTHDSLFVGEDGPTHQPIEQHAALRLIPGLDVHRPADGLEVAASWAKAITRENGPSAILLTRQGLPELERPADFDRSLVTKGAYVLREAEGAKATLMATGSEVSVAVAAADRLAAEGLNFRIVSAPCLEAFDRQPRAYREEVLLESVPTVSIELGTTALWVRQTENAKHVLGIDRFGRSAPAGDIAKDFGLDEDALVEHLRALFG